MAPKKTGEGEATPSPLDEVLSGIARRRLALGKADLKIVEAVKTFEEKLRAHLSTRVSTIIEVTHEQGVEWGEMLTFGKWDGKWQLLIESGITDDPEGWKTQPLVSAAREKRVRVFTDGIAEKLVREADEQLQAQLVERDRAVKIADNLIKALGAAAQKGDDEAP